MSKQENRKFNYFTTVKKTIFKYYNIAQYIL